MEWGHLRLNWLNNALGAVFELTTRESRVKRTPPQVVLALTLKAGQLGSTEGLNIDHQNSCLVSPSRAVEVLTEVDTTLSSRLHRHNQYPRRTASLSSHIGCR